MGPFYETRVIRPCSSRLAVVRASSARGAYARHLEAVNGTPIADLKPILGEHLRER
jgi:tRNA (Thr-GGU) A37 N-methylase